MLKCVGFLSQEIGYKPIIVKIGPQNGGFSNLKV